MSMKKNWLAAGSLAVLASVVYFASLVSYAFPGESAHLQALWAGLDPAGEVVHPLMAVFARFFGGGNMLAPVCGVLAVVLVYWLVSSFVAGVITSEHARPHAESIGLVSGYSAALLFMFTPAVREAASHLEPRLFDALWAFLSLLPLIAYSKASKVAGWFYPPVLGAMVAVGLCDSALFVALSPFFVWGIVSAELRRGNKPYAALMIFAVSFLVVFFVAIDVFELELTPLLKGMAGELKDYTSSSYWVFVLIFSTIPFLVSLFSCPRAFNDKPGLVQWLFHVSMSLFAIIAIATPLSPSSLMAKEGVFPVVTSGFAAAFGGYLVAFWWFYRRKPVGVASGVILVFVLAFASLWNLFAFDGNRGAFADKVASRVLADMGERTWLVTDGTLDDHLRLVAKAEGREINLIALQRDLDAKYLDALGAVIAEKKIGGSKNSELTLSLSLGVLPFVQDWFSADTSVPRTAAIWGAPDLWYSAGLKPIPEFLFFGSDTSRTPDWSAWREFDTMLEAPKGWGSYSLDTNDPVDKLRLSLRRHIGLIANNRGVWLQDMKKDDEAFKMYELVLNEIDSDNVCSLFNEIEMAGRKHPGALAKKRELERRIKGIVDDKSRRYVIWRLASFYGYIRNPEMFMRLGFSWARSGRPGDALAQIRRAIDFVPTEKRATLLNMMAALYANDNDQLKSRRIYAALLSKNPADRDALMGMMRLKLMDGDQSGAREYLDKAVKSSPSEGRRGLIEKAMLAMMDNDYEGAKSLLRKVLDADGRDMQAWSLLAAAAMQQADSTKDEGEKDKVLKDIQKNILPEMEKQTSNPYDYHVQATKAFLLLHLGKERRREARDAFAAAVRVRPDATPMQDLVLGLDISLDDKSSAERHARDVLRRNRNAPLANYVMGSIALGRGKYQEAEAFLRKAAEAAKPNVLALNDLAEVLRRTDRLPEAEQHVRKAIEISPKFYILYETLASVLMDQKRNLEEAESSIRKAIDLVKGESGQDADVRMYSSLARVQSMRGDMKGAKISIRKVQNRISELSEFEKREFEEIRNSVH
jgi:tetratricopeptide (TPR) repeat protein